jgi:hypothetical protein
MAFQMARRWVGAAGRPFHVVLGSALVSTLIAAGAGTAHAYDVASSSSGEPLHWADGEVVFTTAFEPGPTGLTVTAAEQVAARSISTWQASLAATSLSTQLASTHPIPAVHANDGVNTIRWGLTMDDPDLEPGVLAHTFIAYRTATGEIVDTDIVLNGHDFAWTTEMTGCGNEYDLESALTHELGHAFGLSHSIGHPDATMFATGDACESTKRDLDPDDDAGIQALYAQQPPPPADSGCAAAGSEGSLVVGLLVFGCVVGRRRRWTTATLAVGVLCLTLPRISQAAQLRLLDVPTLATDAVMVIRGHVVAVAVAPGTPLETETTVEVAQCLSSACPPTVTVRRHGGERDGIGLVVDGEAAPPLGAEVVMFLRVDRAGRVRALGGIQGVWQVVRTGRAVDAVRDLRGHDLLDTDHFVPGTVQRIELAALLGQVAAIRARTRR